MEQQKQLEDERVKNELLELDKETIQVDGTILKPSQCFHFESNPLHLLFNTNCPDSLKQRVSSIVSKYYPGYESRSPEY